MLTNFVRFVTFGINMLLVFTHVTSLFGRWVVFCNDVTVCIFYSQGRQSAFWSSRKHNKLFTVLVGPYIEKYLPSVTFLRPWGNIFIYDFYINIFMFLYNQVQCLYEIVFAWDFGGQWLLVHFLVCFSAVFDFLFSEFVMSCSFTETALWETNRNVLARFIVRNTSIKIPSSLPYLLLINTNIFPPKLPKNP